ncbi:MAG: radical SAM protein [Candidatus Eisenbacteria bacterium]|nr:radical SAM protein [Candidatus Eisenbacteria bacterium]
MSLLVKEIFTSIQGESSFQGLPCVFVRLSGCNLRCTYCDSRYAYEGGQEMTINEVLREAGRSGVKLVEITGGEPLLQEETPNLVRALTKKKFTVLVETNGTVDISKLSKKAVKIVDIKCPGSGESARVNWRNLKLIGNKDEVKFVVQDRADYEWAKKVTRRHKLTEKSNVLFSCAFGRLHPCKLADWILEDGLDVRLNLQLHKYIWGRGTRK